MQEMVDIEMTGRDASRFKVPKEREQHTYLFREALGATSTYGPEHGNRCLQGWAQCLPGTIGPL